MKRNKFSLSNYKLLSCDMGELVPIGLTEVLPGDTIQQATSALIRVSPLLAPVMHPVNVKVHHWFVPHRLVWDDWENFITGGPDGNNASTFPTITVNSGTGWAVGSLADYLGLPTGVDDIAVSALPFRAYSKIWNEFYRDQDLQTALTIDTTDGADTTTNTTLQNVCWEKDYFTTARPWTQKGDEVTMPLGTEADVYGRTQDNSTNRGNVFQQYNTTNTAAQYGQVNKTGGALTIDVQNFGGMDAGDTAVGLSLGTPGQYAAAGSDYLPPYADLTNATAATINELRYAFALQRYKEARARYGSRYTEYLRYYGIRSSDARLQRPEYLGGGKQTIQFSEVLQTGVTTSGNTAGVGSLRGHGIGAMRSNRYRKFFEEHGYVVSLLSVQPKTMYFEGIPKTWLRATKEDFFQKELERVGQGEVLNKELYAAHATPNGVFGYQDRYDEYRRAESTISGEFRSTLNFWHYARDFSSDPALNATFVSSNPTNRVYQSTSTDQLWIMANHSIQARRMLAKDGTPSVI